MPLKKETKPIYLWQHEVHSPPLKVSCYNHGNVRYTHHHSKCHVTIMAT